MGVPQYVNPFRAATACWMLSETELPVTEIVFAVGFATKFSFNREFSRSYGVSPSAWHACNRRNTATAELMCGRTLCGPAEEWPTRNIPQQRKCFHCRAAFAGGEAVQDRGPDLSFGMQF